MKVNKIFKNLIFTIFLFFVSYNITLCDELNVGIVLPLSGPGATWGKHLQNGALLAYETLPDNLKNKLNIKFEDDQLKSSLSISAFRKLTSSKDTDLIVLFGGHAGAPVVPIAEKLKIPSITITAKREIVLNKKYAMRHWIDSETQVKTVFEKLRERKIKNSAVVLTSHDATVDLADEFEVQAKKENFEILVREEFATGPQDFRAHILKIKTLNPEAIIVGLLPGHVATFFKQLDELKVRIPCFAFTPAGDSSELKAAGSSMNGLIFVAPNFESSFVKDYEEKYGVEPEGAAGSGFDIIVILKSALEKNKIDRESLNSYLHSIHDFQGSMGSYGIGAYNDFMLPAKLMVVREGRFEDL